ncbi:hypothetical protein SK128_016000 [Halocaridina rubra]|uniref:Uncharacterized protein n=1 Tax=Halocaridina rubra TaxID=373956 RepID=A0AAN9A9G4_HALRR
MLTQAATEISCPNSFTHLTRTSTEKFKMNIRSVVPGAIFSYFLLLLLEPSYAGQGIIWKPMTISLSRLQFGARFSSIITVPAEGMNCAYFCHQTEWCNIWCPDLATGNACFVFDMYVVPGYVELNLGDAQICYTNTPIDFAVGSSIEGADPYPTMLPRVKENLVDGIFDYQVDSQCYISEKFNNPWFRVDLGTARPIRQVIMVLQSNIKARQMYDIIVRAGMYIFNPANFDNMKTFHYFPGPSYESMEVVLEKDDPLWARYVVVQRLGTLPLCTGTIDDILCKLQICHLEILSTHHHTCDFDGITIAIRMKRIRDQIPEEEPLSKRINNLHIDGSSPLLNGSSVPTSSYSIPPSIPSYESNCTSLQDRLQSSTPIVVPNNGVYGYSGVNGSASITNGGIHGDNHSHNVHNGVDRLLSELIANRDLPDSLNICYPEINPTNNDVYFGFNKVLHDLHIERLKRLGKIVM